MLLWTYSKEGTQAGRSFANTKEKCDVTHSYLGPNPTGTWLVRSRGHEL